MYKKIRMIKTMIIIALEKWIQLVNENVKNIAKNK